MRNPAYRDEQESLPPLLPINSLLLATYQLVDAGFEGWETVRRMGWDDDDAVRVAQEILRIRSEIPQVKL